jgi:RNA recognition motif-containing protein
LGSVWVILAFHITKEKKMDNKLFVGNISFRTTEEDLQNLFSQAGNVTSVAIIKDRDTGRSRGFAFVEMSSQVEAEKAISMFNGTQFNERELVINIARPRDDRGPGGGGGGGGFNRRGGGGSGGGRQQGRGGPRERTRRG